MGLFGYFLEIIARRQKPLTLCHFVGTVAPGSPSAFESPCVGYAWVAGMVYSNHDVSIQLEQGVAGLAGTLNYRHASPLVVVAAGTAEIRKFPIGGRFCRLSIINNGVVAADVEAYFEMRGFA